MIQWPTLGRTSTIDFGCANLSQFTPPAISIFLNVEAAAFEGGYESPCSSAANTPACSARR